MDFRVDTGFFRHVKTRRLESELGQVAVLSLLRLWGYCAENATSGALRRFDSIDLELVSGWPGKAGAFCERLLALGFIHQTDCGYLVNDWDLHQPYLAQSEARREACREAGRRGGFAKALAKKQTGETLATATKKHSENLAKASDVLANSGDSLAKSKQLSTSPPLPSHPIPTLPEEKRIQPIHEPLTHDVRERACEGDGNSPDENAGPNDHAKSGFATHIAGDTEEQPKLAANQLLPATKSPTAAFDALYSHDPALEKFCDQVMAFYPKHGAKLPPRHVARGLLRDLVPVDERENMLRGLHIWLLNEEWKTRFAPKLRKFLIDEEWRSPPIADTGGGPVTQKGKTMKNLIENFIAAAPEGEGK